jgi:DNA-binding response OmpR family regulator
MATILLVEDNPDITFIYKDALEHSGHHVDTAGDGQDGLNKAKSKSYDLILLDLMLPGKHGMQVLQELRDDEATKNIPVYVLSALSDRIISDQASNLGAKGFFVKSEFSPGDLVVALEKVLEKPAEHY